MSSASISTLSPPASDFLRSLHEGSSDTTPSKHDHFSKILYAGHDFEKQIYIISCSPCTASTLHHSYLAAQSRVRQYTEFVVLLKRTEAAWAEKLQEAGHVLTEKNLSRVSLKETTVEDDEQDILLAHTIETVSANLTTAQHRVRQYTQFLMILKSEEDAWAQRFQKASCEVTSLRVMLLPRFQLYFISILHGTHPNIPSRRQFYVLRVSKYGNG
ncbi:hypothetical protein EV702DRAFT_91604 [Suillus placidus]|uniref:Uncharacterized protein n=1 Tax=Suillus placidus TaxID=48579 RepID=A0A9P7CVS9_9AGAM|nr:hypothetical protein EV702DRAFT_91604 [Suillus placidus]